MSIPSRRRRKIEKYYHNKKLGICVYCKKNKAEYKRVGCAKCLKKISKIKRNQRKRNGN